MSMQLNLSSWFPYQNTFLEKFTNNNWEYQLGVAYQFVFLAYKSESQKELTVSFNKHYLTKISSLPLFFNETSTVTLVRKVASYILPLESLTFLIQNRIITYRFRNNSGQEKNFQYVMRFDFLNSLLISVALLVPLLSYQKLLSNLKIAAKVLVFLVLFSTIFIVLKKVNRQA